MPSRMFVLMSGVFGGDSIVLFAITYLHHWSEIAIEWQKIGPNLVVYQACQIAHTLALVLRMISSHGLVTPSPIMALFSAWSLRKTQSNLPARESRHFKTSQASFLERNHLQAFYQEHKTIGKDFSLSLLFVHIFPCRHLLYQQRNKTLRLTPDMRE